MCASLRLTVNQSQIIVKNEGFCHILVAVNMYTVAVFAVQFDISPALIIVLCPDSVHKKPDSFLCNLSPGKEEVPFQSCILSGLCLLGSGYLPIEVKIQIASANILPDLFKTAVLRKYRKYRQQCAKVL